MHASSHYLVFILKTFEIHVLIHREHQLIREMSLTIPSRDWRVEIIMRTSATAFLMTFVIIFSMAYFAMPSDHDGMVSAAQSGEYSYDTYGGGVYLSGYTGPGGAVVVPNMIDGKHVTALWKTFAGCTNVTSVVIPHSVIDISGMAFSECTSLTSVTIPGSVVEIGMEAFYHCTSLRSVTIPNSVFQIMTWAFFNCTSLTDITIGRGVGSIGDSALLTKAPVTNITFNGNPPSIGQNWIDPSATTINYHPNSIGFTTPTWQGAPTHVLPDSAPSVPEFLKAIPGTGSVTLNWSAPVNDGGAAISSYAVYQDGALANSINSTQVTISGLKAGTEYNFTVTAHNTVGDSPTSSPVSAAPLTEIPSPSTDPIPLIVVSTFVALLAAVLLLRRARSHE
jgi:hypothetical protein